MVVVAAISKMISAAAFGMLGVLGFSQDNITSIVVAAIGAIGLIASTRHGRRLKRVEDSVHATRDAARSSADELAALGREHNGEA